MASLVRARRKPPAHLHNSTPRRSGQQVCDRQRPSLRVCARHSRPTTGGKQSERQFETTERGLASAVGRQALVRWESSEPPPLVAWRLRGRPPTGAGRRRELDDTDRRFCARVDCWLRRRSVRLWGESGEPGTGIMCSSGVTVVDSVDGPPKRSCHGWRCAPREHVHLGGA
jgi:hypothetical protein